MVVDSSIESDNARQLKVVKNHILRYQNYFLDKYHMFAMEKHNLLIWDVLILSYIEHPHYNENVRKSNNQCCRFQYSPPINWNHFAFGTLNHGEHTIQLRRKIQEKTLEHEIYQLNLQQHTHPASHKNSALRVSLLFMDIQ